MMRYGIIAALLFSGLVVPAAAQQQQYSPDQDAYVIMQKASNLAQYADSIEQRNAMLGKLLAEAQKRAEAAETKGAALQRQVDEATKKGAELQKKVDDLTKQLGDLKKGADKKPAE